MVEPFVPNHQHLLVNAKLRKPPVSKAEIEEWLVKVVKAVDMEILAGPYSCQCADLGNEGVTGVIVLSTSHCSIHAWDKADVPYANFDIYSCKPFSLEQVEPLIAAFDPYFYEYMWIDRNSDGLKASEPESKQCIRIIDLMKPEDREAYGKSYKFDQSSKRDQNRLDYPEEFARYKQAESAYRALRDKYSFRALKTIRKWATERLYSHESTITAIRSRAKRKQLDFDLDAEWYTFALQNALSKYPKLQIHEQEGFWAASVDRIVPSLGYIKSNCRIIPSGLNTAKWTWTKDELTELLELLRSELS